MRTIFFLLISVLCIGVLVSGHLHWQNKLTTIQVQGKDRYEQFLMEELKAKEERIRSLDPELNQNQPMIDFLIYKALTQEKVTVAALGSNGTAGIGASHLSNTWLGLLERGLRAEYRELSNLTVSRHGFAGYSTKDLINNGKVMEVMKEQPDVVFLETSVLNNYHQSITIEQTLNELESLVTSLQMGLPNSKIILLSPNPIINSENRNSIDLSYIDYLNESMKKIKASNWPYIDSNGKILAKVNEENMVLADVMANDYFHLNDKGNSLWYEVIMDFIKNDSFGT